MSSTISRPRRQHEGRTGERILDVAERLVQSRGFNGFSYADVARELGVTKASLHYHYPGKAELGEALIRRYGERFFRSLAAIEAAEAGAGARLAGYVGLYAGVLREQRMCLCGMLAADYSTLPPGMRQAVIEFFDGNQVWLERLLASGQSEGAVSRASSAAELAQLVVASLEGAMLVARPYGDTARFEAAASRLLAGLLQ